MDTRDNLVEHYFTILFPCTIYRFDEAVKQWCGVLNIQGQEIRASVYHEDTKQQCEEEFADWLRDWIDACLNSRCLPFFEQLVKNAQDAGVGDCECASAP